MYVSKFLLLLILLQGMAAKDVCRVGRLTDGKYDDRSPVWSPDGGFIAYVSLRGQKRSLVLRRSDGSGDEKILAENVGENPAISWRPDSRVIAVAARDRNKDAVYAIDIVTGKCHAFSGTAPRYSPDGKILAVTQKGKFVFIDAAKGRIVREIDLNMPSIVHGFDWSSDGRTIFYSCNGDLWRMDVASQSSSMIVDHTKGEKGITSPFIESPRVDSTGTRVIYSLIVDGLYAGVAHNMIGSYDIKNKKSRILTDADQWDISPCGRWVMVAVGPQLMLYDMKQNKSAVIGKGGDPSFSSDGHYITYSHFKELFASGEIFIMDISKLVDLEK